jgi:hypothetical protein
MLGKKNKTGMLYFLPYIFLPPFFFFVIQETE